MKIQQSFVFIKNAIVILIMDYQVLISCDKETGWVVVEVPNLPGCISQGKTKREALENTVDAIQGYLVSLANHPKDQEISRL